MSVYLVVLSSFLHSCTVPDPPICKMVIPTIIGSFLLSEQNQDISYRHGRDVSFRIIDSIKFPTFTLSQAYLFPLHVIVHVWIWKLRV